MLRRLSVVMGLARLFWNWLQQKIRNLVDFDHLLVDSTSLEVVLAQRVSDKTENRFNGSNISKKTIRKCWYFGRKVHILVSENGTLFRFRTSKASEHDSRMLCRLKLKKNKVLTGDGGYKGKETHVGGKLKLTRPWGTKKAERELAGKRCMVEKVFNVLKELGLEGRHKIRCSRSLDSHIVACLACVLGMQYLNLKKRLSPLSYKHFVL